MLLRLGRKPVSVSRLLKPTVPLRQLRNFHACPRTAVAKPHAAGRRSPLRSFQPRFQSTAATEASGSKPDAFALAGDGVAWWLTGCASLVAGIVGYDSR